MCLVGFLNIPESSNGIPDIMYEADYGSQFMKRMFPFNGGLASHKAHKHAWSDFFITVKGENELPISAMGPSTPATYAVARVCAHLGCRKGCMVPIRSITLNSL